jgi:signal peptidase II
LLVIELIFAIAFIHWEKTLFIVVIAIDQFFKAHITSTMTLGESIPVIQNFFHFTYVLNPGAAFGILPNQRVFFLITGAVLLLATMYFYPRIKKNDRLLKFGVINLVSGSTANLIDRFQTGYVIDFIDFRIWPIFNIADIAIVFGMFIVIYFVAFKMENKEAQKK